MKRYNKIIFLIILLGVISIINIYNGKYLNIYYENYYIKQFIYYIIGLIIIIIFNKLNLNFLYKYSLIIYYINLFLLILVLFKGSIINGSRAWLDFKIFSMQPSEFMKLSLTLLFCQIVHKKNIFILIIYTLIPSILVFLEPDTGAIIFYLIILITFMFIKKVNFKIVSTLLSISLIFILSFIYLYFFNQDILIKLIGSSFFYRVDRLINFSHENYQINLALTSIFANTLFRNGFNNILIYIPEGITDFILAFTIGNYGLIMLPIILLLYYLIINNLFKLKITNKKTNYLLISFNIMFFIQILINTFMNIGLFPIIGITLPFLSYGGSSLILYFLYIAIIISYSKDS